MMDDSVKLNVFGKQVLAIKAKDGWRLFYLSAEGKRRPASDIFVPEFVTEFEIEQYLTDLCHEWATERYPSVHRIE